MDAHFANVAHLGPKWTGRDEVDVLLVRSGLDRAGAGRHAGDRVADGVGLPALPGPRGLRRGRRRPRPGMACGLHRASRRRRARRGRAGRPRAPGPRRARGPLAVLRHRAASTSSATPSRRSSAWVLDAVDVAAIVAAQGDDAGRRAVVDGVEAAQAIVDAVLTTWPTQDGWRLPLPWIGLPNAHVAENAALQLFQVGSNDLGEAAYFFGDLDDEGRRLDGSAGAVYRLRFAAGCAAAGRRRRLLVVDDVRPGQPARRQLPRPLLDAGDATRASRRTPTAGSPCGCPRPSPRRSTTPHGCRRPSGPVPPRSAPLLPVAAGRGRHLVPACAARGVVMRLGVLSPPSGDRRIDTCEHTPATSRQDP